MTRENSINATSMIHSPHSLPEQGASFEDNIIKFNKMYKMNVNKTPTLTIGEDPRQRLINFKKILGDELDEIDVIISQFDGEINELDILTNLADLLGDLQIYCASEMVKFGIPIHNTLSVIMDSNFSKMGSDNTPIYDSYGKLQKGPNYFRPEPMILEVLRSKIKARSKFEVQFQKN